MSKRIFGRLTNERVDGQGHREPLIGFRVTVRYGSFSLGNGITVAPDGVFQFDYDRRGPGSTREVELVAQDNAGRVLPFATESGRWIVQDLDGELLSLGDIVIREADARGLAVTLGTGEVRARTSGNRVKLLVDQEAFVRTAELIQGAREWILISQLYLSLPEEFDADPAKETPKLVFDFHQTPPDFDHPRALLPTDARPERLLAEVAARGVDVRIILHGIRIPLWAKLVLGALVFPFAGSDGISLLLCETLGTELTGLDEAKGYFTPAAPTVKIQGFFQNPVLVAGAMHVKLVDVDGRTICLGAPFGQSYVDSPDHRIDAWIRGASTGLPKHDVGFETTGPAWLDLYQVQKLLWDTAVPADPLPDVPGSADPLPTPHPPPMPELEPDAVCSLQVVRTLTAGRFPGLDDGEKGVLEAYLRAFNTAADYIYLENQYFTNSAIGDALVSVMKSKPNLQVIVVLNIDPDQFLYPWTQRRLITRIRKAIKQQPDGPQRFGVFTRWTHETGTPRPRILPIYVHSKVAIVDDTWATIGSANLDGISLDSYGLTDFLRKVLPIREQRAVEFNAVLVNDAAEDPKVGDVLRRKLWAEHLGYAQARDVPDPEAPALLTRPATGWLQLWLDRANDTLQQLRTAPAQPLTGMARVLPWPLDNTTHKTPRDHLQALGINTHDLVPLKSTCAFDFRTGQWKPGSVAKMDY